MTGRLLFVPFPVGCSDDDAISFDPITVENYNRPKNWWIRLFRSLGTMHSRALRGLRKVGKSLHATKREEVESWDGDAGVGWRSCRCRVSMDCAREIG